MEKRFTLVVSAILIIIGQLTLSHAVEVKLIASDEAAGDDFGNSVSIDGDTVIVGAEANDHAVPGSNRGAAYIFVRNGSNTIFS